MINPYSDIYDPDVKIYINNAAFNYWKVLLKEPDGTPYENK